MTLEELNAFKILVRSYYDYQKERMAMDGRLGMKSDGTEKKNTPPRDPVLLAYLMQRREELIEFEDVLLKEIKRKVHTHPLWKCFLEHVKGCGEAMAAVIITEIDIERAPAVSNIWSFAGMAPGKDRREKGKKRSYNQFLKDKMLGVLGSSFLKCQSAPYSTFYYNEKTRLENSDVLVSEIKEKGAKPEMIAWKDAKKDHRHKAANRKMVKEFIKDLYVAWRELEGLPVRAPYAEEYLGKVHSGQGEAEVQATL